MLSRLRSTAITSANLKSHFKCETVFDNSTNPSLNPHSLQSGCQVSTKLFSVCFSNVTFRCSEPNVPASIQRRCVGAAKHVSAASKPLQAELKHKYDAWIPIFKCSNAVAFFFLTIRCLVICFDNISGGVYSRWAFKERMINTVCWGCDTFCVRH